MLFAACDALRCRPGCLTLVDLAGSERDTDTTAFTSEEHRESARIMLGLLALKDCLSALAQAAREEALVPDGRAAAAAAAATTTREEGGEACVSGKGRRQRRIPYRSSVLTKLLKECFEDEAHHTNIIGTVSPTSGT